MPNDENKIEKFNIAFCFSRNIFYKLHKLYIYVLFYGGCAGIATQVLKFRTMRWYEFMWMLRNLSQQATACRCFLCHSALPFCGSPFYSLQLSSISCEPIPSWQSVSMSIPDILVASNLTRFAMCMIRDFDIFLSLEFPIASDWASSFRVNFTLDI